MCSRLTSTNGGSTSLAVGCEVLSVSSILSNFGSGAPETTVTVWLSVKGLQSVNALRWLLVAVFVPSVLFKSYLQVLRIRL